jgi:hypothetical protein
MNYNCGRIVEGLTFMRLLDEVVKKHNIRLTAWERGITNQLRTWFLGFGGRIRELSEMPPATLEEARSRGDVYSDMATRFFTTAHLVELAADNPEKALSETANAIVKWRKTRYDVQHFGATFASLEAHLYAGRSEQARALIRADWISIRRSLLFRKSHVLRFTLFYAAGRASLGEWLRCPEIQQLRVETEKFARKLRKLQSAWGHAFSLALQAGIAAGLNHHSESLLLLERAEEILRAQDLRLLAAAVLRRRGELEGDAGSERVKQADAFMRSEGILCLERMTSMILPGAW